MSLVVQPQRFWEFEHCSKLDVLQESSHLHIVLAALQDEETSVEQIDRRTFSLTGPDQSLLIVPQSGLLWLTLALYQTVIRLESWEMVYE